MIQVIMYSRHGCHLCEEAWRTLQELERRYGLELSSVDVDTDVELQRLHGERVPVLVVNGKEWMWGQINRVWLERGLAASLAARSSS
jgi:glutaredoxin